MSPDRSAEDPYSLVVERAFPGSRLLSREPLTGGVSATMHALVLETPDEPPRDVVVRLQSDAEWKAHETSVSAKEFALLEALRQRRLAVPEPLYLDETADVMPRPYYVMARVEGSTTVAAHHLSGSLEQMADFLVQLHLQDAPEALAPGLPPLEDPRTEVFQYLDSCSQDSARDELREQVRAGLENRRTEPVNPPALIHGDFWPGNVLWHEGQLAAVIDWEDAALGDPLADLAAARVELLCQYDEHAMDHFTSSYLERSRLDLTDLPLWEIYVSASALATMEHWGLDPEEEARRRRATESFLRRAVTELTSPSTDP